jgi:pimeloyl-ACP methyl ester carboxylesterase
MLRRVALVLLLLCLFSALTIAQEEVTPTPAPEFEPVAVELTAPDGKTLYGSYFSKSDGEGRAVLLLHQLYTNHTSWTPLIYPLMDAGYKVLAVDLRGYGKTRGKISWTAAQDDTVAWADWLKGQPGVTSVAVVGSSMGSSLALVGCAAIEGCIGAVAISPGINYFDVYTGDAVQAGFPSLLIYAENDRYPKVDVPQLKELGGDHVQVQLYAGRAHGVDLFKTYDDIVPLIVSWIGER